MQVFQLQAFVLPPDLIVFQWSDETNFNALWVYVFSSVLGQGDSGYGVESG